MTLEPEQHEVQVDRFRICQTCLTRRWKSWRSRCPRRQRCQRCPTRHSCYPYQAGSGCIAYLHCLHDAVALNTQKLHLFKALLRTSISSAVESCKLGSPFSKHRLSLASSGGLVHRADGQFCMDVRRPSVRGTSRVHNCLIIKQLNGPPFSSPAFPSLQ